MSLCPSGMCHRDRPLTSPCDTRHLSDSDRLLLTPAWTHWNLHPRHTCVTIMIKRRCELCNSLCNSCPRPNHLCCETPLSVPMFFAREAQPLLPDDFNLEDAVDATQTGAQARHLLQLEKHSKISDVPKKKGHLLTFQNVKTIVHEIPPPSPKSWSHIDLPNCQDPCLGDSPLFREEVTNFFGREGGEEGGKSQTFRV